MNNWKQATYWGISIAGNPDDQDSAFHAGHINDILRINDSPIPTVLVAGQTSGVWLVNQTGGLATPLSESWQFPNLNSLAHGVHGARHVYAGGDGLYETDVTAFFQLYTWNQIPIIGTDRKPLDSGGINDIVVVGDHLVLACGKGIFWAVIPEPGGTYLFKNVPFMPAGAYSGVAEGAQSTVAAAAWGSNDVGHFGLFYGDWSSGDLLFSRASVFGNVNDKMMLRTSIDSCRMNRAVMYAVAGANYLDDKGKVINDTIYRVLKSGDSGQSWQVTGNTVTNSSDPLFGDPSKNLPGNNQFWNNCIAASPTNPRLVALGWRDGYFISTNAGDSWQFFSSSTSPHLHSDFHAVAFDQFDASQRTLYIGSDGGLAITTDMGVTYNTQSNRQLPNLQVYRLAASYQTSGLLAMSLQDSGDDFCTLFPKSTPWTDIDGGDGSAVAFIQNGRLLRYNNDTNSGDRVIDAHWDAASSNFVDEQYFPNPPLSWGVIPLDGTNDGLLYPRLEIVNNPVWKNAQQELLVAVGGKDDKVYGLFLKADSAVHWTQLGTIPAQVDDKGSRIESISAVGSSDGNNIFVGTDKGHIFKLKAPRWTVSDVTPPGNTSAVWRFVVQSEMLVFAMAAGQQLFELSGSAWTPLASPAGTTGDYSAIEMDSTVNPKTLFLSTDNRVFLSGDDGAKWTDISAGLPETPHCKDLRFVTDVSGAHYLYLATYGRSIFRLLLNATDIENRRVKIVGKMDIVDRVATGHDIWAHPQFSNTAVLGGEHPVEDVTISEDGDDEILVKLNVHLQWFLDESIDVHYSVALISKDEGNNLDDHKEGSFKLNKGDSKNVVEDLASDEYWPDRAHIEFAVSNN